MKTTEISRKIEHPNSFSSNDVGELEQLIQKYPYAQTFPILLLKTLGQSKDLHFEEALNKYAFRISDRMHLYYLINNISEDEEKVASLELQVASSEDEEKVASLELQVTSFDDEEKVVEEKSESDENIVRLDYEKLLDEDITFAKVEEMTFEPVRIHITESGDVKGVVETEKAILKEKEIISIESTIEDEIAEASAEIEELIDIPTPTIQEQKARSIQEEVETEIKEEELSSTVEIEFFDPTEDLGETKSMEDLFILEPSSFEEQQQIISLDLISKKFNPADDELTSNAISQSFHITLDPSPSLKDQSGISETIQKFEQNSSTEKRSFYSWLHANEKSLTPEKADRSTEIIEKFIQEEPKMSRSVKEEPSAAKKKVPFFKATEKAKESLQENVIPVSFTLAQIFEAQGNFPKAIHSYEQLMLLYPEKKTFFANQIKNLKEKLNK